MLARKPGTALIKACSTDLRTAAARPSDQAEGMCMCMSTNRRCPARRVTRWSKRIALWRKPSRVVSIWARTSGSSAWSIKPSVEAQTSSTPSRAMLIASRIAITGSSQSQPVACTASRPTITPAEVQTSVIRWRASPSSAIERCSRALRSMAQASAPLSTELSTDSVIPNPKASRGCGSPKRCTAAQMMASAATRISTPSKPLEKYSALW